MGKSILLRLPNGVNPPKEVMSSLNKLLPGHQIHIERYSSQPNYAEQISKRIASLYEAFLFAVDSHPKLTENLGAISVSTLKSYAAKSKELCQLKAGDSLENLHKELEKYTANLLDLLMVFLRTDVINEAIEFLNEAEQYALLAKGRPDLATLTPMGNGYVLQLDKSLSPVYPQLLTELETIRTKKFPKTPLWFYDLPVCYQSYLCKLPDSVKTHTLLEIDHQSLVSSFMEAKGNALHWAYDLQLIATEASPLPAWYTKLPPHHKTLVLAFAQNESSMSSLLTGFTSVLAKPELKPFIFSQFSELPEWYWVLPSRQQYFLEHALPETQDISEALSFISSRLRTIPAPANYGVHSLYSVSAKGDITLLGKERYRSSHIASRDSIKGSDSVQERHAGANFEKVTSEAKANDIILMQTLISPIYGADKVSAVLPEFLGELPPDLDLYNCARKIVKKSRVADRVSQHNHPYNVAKYIFCTQATDPDSIAFIKKLEPFLKIKPGLAPLLDNYKKVLGSALGTATLFDYEGREMFLSSIEQLAIMEIDGFSYGSCVSGKDRKALELIHTDAMLIYRTQHPGKLPTFGEPKDKKERITFVNLVAELYLSRHQHVHAGFNAPGSEGIKTPTWYFSKDIITAINGKMRNESYLSNDDRLATDNEVKNIGSKKFVANLLPNGQMLCYLMAMEIGEENCKNLYDSLVRIVNEQELFKVQTSFFKAALPAGISQLKVIFDDPNLAKTNVHRMARSFSEVMKRPRDDASRKQATRLVYEHIRTIVESKADTLNKRINDAITAWDTLFSESKSTRDNSPVGTRNEEQTAVVTLC